MSYTHELKENSWLPFAVLLLCLVVMIFILCSSCDFAWAKDYSDNEIADAIFKAEGDKWFYGIQSDNVCSSQDARKMCINTIRHARRDWDGKGDFISFLGSRYAPTKNATNDPNGLNKNWVSNIKWFLENKK